MLKFLKGKLYVLNNTIRYYMIIRKVWKNKSNNQMLITIPNDSGIKEGDYVRVKKVEE